MATYGVLNLKRPRRGPPLVFYRRPVSSKETGRYRIPSTVNAYDVRQLSYPVSRVSTQQHPPLEPQVTRPFLQKPPGTPTPRPRSSLHASTPGGATPRNPGSAKLTERLSRAVSNHSLERGTNSASFDPGIGTLTSRDSKPYLSSPHLNRLSDVTDDDDDDDDFIDVRAARAARADRHRARPRSSVGVHSPQVPVVMAPRPTSQFATSYTSLTSVHVRPKMGAATSNYDLSQAETDWSIIDAMLDGGGGQVDYDPDQEHQYMMDQALRAYREHRDQELQHDPSPGSAAAAGSVARPSTPVDVPAVGAASVSGVADTDPTQRPYRGAYPYRKGADPTAAAAAAASGVGEADGDVVDERLLTRRPRAKSAFSSLPSRQVVSITRVGAPPVVPGPPSSSSSRPRTGTARTPGHHQVAPRVPGGPRGCRPGSVSLASTRQRRTAGAAHAGPRPLGSTPSLIHTQGDPAGESELNFRHLTTVPCPSPCPSSSPTRSRSPAMEGSSSGTDAIVRVGRANDLQQGKVGPGQGGLEPGAKQGGPETGDGRGVLDPPLEKDHIILGAQHKDPGAQHRDHAESTDAGVKSTDAGAKTIDLGGVQEVLPVPSVPKEEENPMEILLGNPLGNPLVDTQEESPLESRITDQDDDRESLHRDPKIDNDQDPSSRPPSRSVLSTPTVSIDLQMEKRPHLQRAKSAGAAPAPKGAAKGATKGSVDPATKDIPAGKPSTREPRRAPSKKPPASRADDPSRKQNFDGTFFAAIRSPKRQYFTIHPEWVSENLSVSRMTLKEKTQTYPPRRCKSAPPPRSRNPITWEY